jgi:DNA-binding beta-propeller fold protein YncE
LTNKISVFDSAGNFLRRWGKTGSGDGELMRPAGLAVEKNGNIIVVDSGNNRLQVFKPDGTFVGLVVISVPKVTLRKLLYINGLSDQAQRNSLRPQRSLLS